jgi:hypothetical protein
MSTESKVQRYINFLPPVYKAGTNPFVTALVTALATSDAEVELQIHQAGRQIFQKTAEGKYLDALGSNVGVRRPIAVNLSDEGYRQLIPALSYKPKQIRKTMYEVLDIFWGPLYSRSNVTSYSEEPYNLGNVVTLTGTLTFQNNSLTVSGSGTSFLTQVQSGDFVKLGTHSNSVFTRVARVISNTQLSLASPYPGGENNLVYTGGGSCYTAKYLIVQIDEKEEQKVILAPNYFAITNSVTAAEVATAINAVFPNSKAANSLTASTVQDYIKGTTFLNIRTNTPGPTGAVHIIDGTANVYANGVANFSGNEVYVSNEAAAQFSNGMSVRVGSTTQSAITTTVSFIVNDSPINGISTIYVSNTVSAYLLGDSNYIYQVGKLGLFEGEKLVTDLNLQTVIYEINPKELIIRMPITVPALRRALEGSSHSRGNWSGKITSVDNTLKTVTVNLDDEVKANYFIGKTLSNQLNNFEILGNTSGQSGVVFQFSPTDDLSVLSTLTGENGIVILGDNYQGSFVFDPNTTPYIATSRRCVLNQQIDAGNIYNSITVDGASEIEDELGYLILAMGKENVEQPVKYRSRPNNNTLLLDPSYIFTKTHLPGEIINVLGPTLRGYSPRITGDDLAVYVTGIQEASVIVQEILQSIAASGVKITFIIDAPQYNWYDTNLNELLNS